MFGIAARRERWKARALRAEEALKQARELYLMAAAEERAGNAQRRAFCEATASEWMRRGLGGEPAPKLYRPVRARLVDAAEEV